MLNFGGVTSLKRIQAKTHMLSANHINTSMCVPWEKQNNQYMQFRERRTDYKKT